MCNTEKNTGKLYWKFENRCMHMHNTAPHRHHMCATSGLHVACASRIELGVLRMRQQWITFFISFVEINLLSLYLSIKRMYTIYGKNINTWWWWRKIYIRMNAPRNFRHLIWKWVQLLRCFYKYIIIYIGTQIKNACTETHTHINIYIHSMLCHIL